MNEGDCALDPMIIIAMFLQDRIPCDTCRVDRSKCREVWKVARLIEANAEVYRP